MQTSSIVCMDTLYVDQLHYRIISSCEPRHGEIVLNDIDEVVWKSTFFFQ